jgi:hypothetical protein
LGPSCNHVTMGPQLAHHGPCGAQAWAPHVTMGGPSLGPLLMLLLLLLLLLLMMLLLLLIYRIFISEKLKFTCSMAKWALVGPRWALMGPWATRDHLALGGQLAAWAHMGPWAAWAHMGPHGFMGYVRTYGPSWAHRPSWFHGPHGQTCHGHSWADGPHGPI